MVVRPQGGCGPASVCARMVGDGGAGGICARLRGAVRGGLSAQSGRAARGAAGGGDARRAAGHAAEGDERAAAIASADGLLEGIAANLLLHGNAYVQLIAGRRRSAGGAACAAAGAGERRRPTSAGGRRPISIASAGRAMRIAARDALGRRQVAHVRALHPRDDHYGLGCLDAAIARRRACTIGASRWNKALLDNAARPSGALVYEPADGSTCRREQFDRLKDGAGRAIFRERRMRGGRCCSTAG